MKEQDNFLLNNWGYVLWFTFYFLLTWIFLGGSAGAFLIAGIIYAVSITFSLSSLGEKFFRMTSGIRPLVMEGEQSGIKPIFDEVYEEAKKQTPQINTNIELYIQDTMEINACAMGRTTVAVTKGALQFMSAEEMRGLLAHEFGHLVHGDTKILLMTSIGNGIFNIFILIARWVIRLANSLSAAFEGGPLFFVCWTLGKIFELMLFLFIFIGEIVLMFNSRSNEYNADRYAYNLGYGRNLMSALTKLQQVSTSGRRSIMSLLKATHPSLVNRVLQLQSMTKQEQISGVIS